MSLPEQLQQSDRLDPLVWKITSVADWLFSFAARCEPKGLMGGLGDTSQNGNLCTFAECLCNVLNRLVGQRHKLRSVQERRILY
jgi:hypothetical protein